jgi:recombination protein RecT
MSQTGQSQEIALRQATSSAVSQLQDEDFTRQVELAVPEGVSPRQLLRAAATAVLENPALADPKLRATLLQATLKCAQDGLLPDGRDAAFVIYGGRDTKVQYQPMIGGLRRIAADHGWTIDTHVVYSNDEFDPDFDENVANFKRAPLTEERGEPIGAYSVGRHRDGQRMLEVMSVEEIEKVREVSKAKARGPWVDWWDQMAEKTVGRRLFKKLSLDPKDSRIASVLQAMAEEDPVHTLYGPVRAELRDAPAAASSEDGQRDESAEGADSPADRSNDEIEDGEYEVLNEPSDEELQALGADDENTPVVADDAETRFDKGKFDGKTFSEVYAQGQVGVGYLRWALRDWPEGSFKEALREFAADHEDLQED